jgi:hypothetical protein
METATVGKVLVSAKIENWFDIEGVFRGEVRPEQVRHIELDNALVDKSVTTLSLPKRLINDLGLHIFGKRQARAATGMVTFEYYSPVRLTVQDRDCTIDVTEGADDSPALIGLVPLQLLDFLVDPKNNRLIGNPDHGGVQMWDML